MSNSSARAWLLEHGFDTGGNLCAAQTNRNESRANMARTPMYEACWAGELQMCKWLFSHGASSTIRAKGCLEESPMYAACFKGHLHVAQWLFDVGAKDDTRTVNRFGKTLMFIACYHGNLAFAKWLYEVGAGDDIRIQSHSGRTPLFAACEAGGTQTVQVADWLCQMGAADDVRVRDANGRTPMHAACREGKLAAAKWLFAHGAADDVRALNHEGFTPMHKACRGDHIEVARWLYTVGAAEDIRTEDSNGNSPMHSAGVRTLPWLVAYGAASGDNEHVNPSILARYLPDDAERNALLDALQSSLTTRNAFLQIVLTAVAYNGRFTAAAAAAAADTPLAAGSERTRLVPSGEHTAVRDKRAKTSGAPSTLVGGQNAGVPPNGPPSTRRCVLSKLRGHSTTLLPLIAEFADIPAGRPLRTIREAHRCLTVRAKYDQADAAVKATRQAYVEAIMAHDLLLSESAPQAPSLKVLSMTTFQRQQALVISERISTAFSVLQTTEAARRNATFEVHRMTSDLLS